MKSFVSACLDAALAAGATYADVRVTDTSSERMQVRNATVEALESSASFGFGVRVVADGAWGFASSSDVSEKSAASVAREAVALARASALVHGRAVALADAAPIEGTWSGPCVIDPFTLPLETKLEHLLAAEAAMRGRPGVSLTHAEMGFFKCRKTFGSTDGAFLEQEWVESRAGITAYAIEEGEVCARSYPNSQSGGRFQGGWETILALDLAGNAPRVSDEAAALLRAPECDAGTTTLIIDGSQLALQIHESIGHPTELDRVLGDEAAFAGTSFLTIADLGSLRYGSDHVTITSDGTVPGSLGSFGWDDEGVPAQRDHIVRDGVLTGFQTSRESALAIGRTSNGCMRADGWNSIPLIRMTTLSLEPGPWTLADLIADTDDGLYIETNHSWSIDDKRLNFQFACEIGWEVRNGALGRMVKRPNYTGITPRFWAACDAVCGGDDWRVWGLDNCGKGEPMQVAHVAHGAAPARFRDVQVGVGR